MIAAISKTFGTNVLETKNYLSGKDIFITFCDENHGHNDVEDKGRVPAIRPAILGRRRDKRSNRRDKIKLVVKGAENA